MSKDIRFSPYKLDGKDMIDMRYWKGTRMGPRSVGAGVQFEFKLVPRIIGALQQIWAQQNAEKAKETANKD